MNIIQHIRQRRARTRREAEKRRRRDKQLDELGDYLFAQIASWIHAPSDGHSEDA